MFKSRYGNIAKTLLVLDPVILNQNKLGLFRRIQTLCKAQAFESVAKSYQVMEIDVLSYDLGW